MKFGHAGPFKGDAVVYARDCMERRSIQLSDNKTIENSHDSGGIHE